MRVSAAPQRATQRATSQRGCEHSSASASIGSLGVGSVERVALAVEAAQHRVGQLARADAVAPLGQLDRLRDRCVGGHAPHGEELGRAEAQQVEQIGVEPNGAAAHALVEIRVEPSAAPEHAVDELAHHRRSRASRRDVRRSKPVEQVAAANVRADFGRRDTRVGHTATAVAQRPRCRPRPPGDRWS